MISSMTGFGSAEGKVGAFGVGVEVRTVNHRFFNPSIKLPGAFSKWEGDVRELLRQRITRGHVTVTARIEREGTRTSGINAERFAGYVAAIRELQQQNGLTSTIDAATILSLPGVIDSQAEETNIGSAPELLEIVERAVSSLREMRQVEGERLAGFLLDRIALVESSVAAIQDRAPIRLAEQIGRMRQSIAEIAASPNIDPQRLAQETAILAEKLDISEELERFDAHISAFRQTITGGTDDGVGKRLGFLLQELVREANTTGSKANDAAVLAEVVVIKEELERIREQVENIE